MSLLPYSIFRRGSDPVIAAAIHNGHDTRKRVDERLAIDEQARRREEDPFTAEWTQVAKTQIIGLRSRFEIDLNRPRDKAVYLDSADAWGLKVWQQPPDAAMIRASLREYDQFYASVRQLLETMVAEHGRVVVYDLHSYNHRRGGERSPVADALTNPEVNIGTGAMDRTYWGPVVERFMRELRAYDFQGRSLDVRENVKFQGGYFGKWIHETFPQRVCAIAIEFKKFFMDEWTGDADPRDIEAIYKALRWTLPGVVKELRQL